jgi:class 3 adenylate cyclase/pimeloyl-ACP methyl ester carboxylesterase
MMTRMIDPELKYARSREAQVAYTVRGSGPTLAIVDGTRGMSASLDPLVGSYVDRISGFARVVLHDPRGIGRSDPLLPGEAPTVDEQAADVLAILDDAEIDRVCLLAYHSGGAVGIAFATNYPDRTSGLFIVNGWARLLKDETYRYGITQAFSDRLIAAHGEGLGTGMFADAFSPSRKGDREVKAFYEREEGTASRSQSMLITKTAQELDVRDRLGKVTVPTVVMHNTDNTALEVGHGRYIAEHIAGARFLEFAGTDHMFILEDPEPVLIELEAFVTGHQPSTQVQHGFVTVLYTDLVDSTARVAAIGDRRWRELIERYERDVDERTRVHGGRILKSTGDGVLVTFPVPSNAVRSAMSLVAVSARIGLESRVGLHAGEVELRGGDVIGLAVNLGARVCALAHSGEVLVTRTVKDVLLGSDFEFTDRGTYTLKGVPGSWQLFAVSAQRASDSASSRARA